MNIQFDRETVHLGARVARLDDDGRPALVGDDVPRALRDRLVRLVICEAHARSSGTPRGDAPGGPVRPG